MVKPNAILKYEPANTWEYPLWLEKEFRLYSNRLPLGAVDNWFSSHLAANWPLTLDPLPPSLLTAIRGSFLWKKKENEGKNVDTEKGLGKVVNSNGHAVYPLPL